MENPKVSVLMPAYNAALYIEEAIQSILDQTYSDFEFIIIDDCSTDNTRSIIQNFAKLDNRIIAIRNEENLRICKTLNKWISIAKWEYIARMDADDISLVDRFDKQIKVLDKNTNIWIIWWSMEMFNDKWIVWIREYHQNDLEIRKHIFRYSPFCHPAVIIRKAVLEKSWWYNESWIYWEDYDLYFRIWQYSLFENINEIVIKYRLLSNWMTWLKADYMEYCTQYLKLKAIFEYWYKMSLWDKIYSFTQLLSMIIIRWKFRVKLFNFIRKYI